MFIHVLMKGNICPHINLSILICKLWAPFNKKRKSSWKLSKNKWLLILLTAVKIKFPGLFPETNSVLLQSEIFRFYGKALKGICFLYRQFTGVKKFHFFSLYDALLHLVKKR